MKIYRIVLVDHEFQHGKSLPMGKVFVVNKEDKGYNVFDMNTANDPIGKNVAGHSIIDI